MTKGPTYFDRTGKPLELLRWAELWGDNAYRFVQRTWVRLDAVEVDTVWDGFDPYRVDYGDGPPRIFKVAELHWADGKLTNALEHAMPATEAEAHIAHEAVVSVLQSRTRVT